MKTEIKTTYRLYLIPNDNLTYRLALWCVSLSEYDEDATRNFLNPLKIPQSIITPRSESLINRFED